MLVQDLWFDRSYYLGFAQCIQVGVPKAEPCIFQTSHRNRAYNLAGAYSKNRPKINIMHSLHWCCAMCLIYRKLNGLKPRTDQTYSWEKSPAQK